MAKETKKVNQAVKNAAPVAENNVPANKFPLEKINFVMIAVCIILIVLGFIMMTGSSNDTTTWNPDIFNATRTVVGPLVALAGFVLLVFAIMYKKKDKKQEEVVSEENNE